ncbi:glycoside hydrolase family 2 protein, partial [Bifidobacterium adolescentis]
MGRKYLASLLAVAMFAAGVPCAQAEELDTNIANITDSQTIQGEAQDTGSSDEGTVSSNGTDDALNASADSQIAGRTVENIDKGWMFSKGDASMDGWTFPTGASEGTIDLPHSWDYAHPTMSYIPQNNQKTVTYSKQLDVAKYHDKNLFIKFYGSNKNTTVKVDGQEVGTHVGGYSAFVFDLTKYVQDKNSVALTVDVTNVDTVSIPINVDYTQFSGIYRDVELIALPNQYISTENKGSSGVFVDYQLNGNNASVNTRVDVTNKAVETANLVLKTTISDNAGNIVSEQSSDFQVSAGTEAAEQKLDQQLTNIHRWNGRSDPYLYTMNVSLQDAAGHVLDTESTKIGFRTFNVSNGKAYLNGKQIEIHGVGYHQDREGVGNAVSRAQMAQDIDTMLDMGVNAVRTSHYPHDPAFYEMADEKGLLVYCEIPYYLIYSKAESYKNSITNQLTEMIRQGYNYPSIVMWGVQNEVRYSEQFASYGPDFKVTEDELVAFNSALVDLAHQEDPNRLIVQANIDGADAVNTSAKWSSKIDLTGMNLYVGFKSAVKNADADGHKKLVESLATKMNNYQQVLGADSMMLSEYGAGANIDQHTEVDSSFSWNGAEDANGDKHYEEYQSYLLEAYWDYIQHSNNVAASFVWNMFDFSSYRNAGGKERLNTKGLLCYDHVTKKDAYYFFKANWNK